MVQIHSPRPILLGPTTYTHGKVPTTSWLGANQSVVQMRSPNHFHFLRQIRVKWRDLRLRLSHSVAHRSPNRHRQVREPTPLPAHSVFLRRLCSCGLARTASTPNYQDRDPAALVLTCCGWTTLRKQAAYSTKSSRRVGAGKCHYQ